MLHSLCCLIIHFNKELSFLSLFIPSRHSGGLLAQCSISHQESFHLFPHLKRTRGPHLQMLHRWQISCKKAVSFHTPVPVNCVMEWSWRLTRSLFWWILSFLLHSLDRRVTQVSSCVLWSQIIKPDVLGAAGECAFFSLISSGWQWNRIVYHHHVTARALRPICRATSPLQHSSLCVLVCLPSFIAPPHS